jgi:release factor glutamine methyltransferase
MQIKEALKLAHEKLYESSTPQLDARLLLCRAMNVTHEKLLLSYDKELQKDIENRFFQLVTRRQAMEPIAYILGEQEFYGLKFIVSKDVLIPRPETELLVDALVKDCQKYYRNKDINILELGTGSGAIAVSIARTIVMASVTATDISDKALAIAKHNAEINEVQEQVHFVQSNWYKGLKVQKYDYIISNPPYIDRSEKEQMSKETYLFEPELALYAEDQGLANYKIIIESAYNYLKPNGKLLLEIGYNQKELLFPILKQNNFINLQSFSDLSGHNRVIIAEYCVKTAS